MSGAVAERPSQAARAGAGARPPGGSAIYEGWVAHRRTSPVSHSFRYRMFMPLFDLEELPELLDGIPLWSARRPAPARFRRSDYLGDGSVPLAEVTSTPWGERRAYVLDGGPGGLRGDFDKRMHVSPFMPMEQSYEWSATEPGDRLAVSIRNVEAGRTVFEASIGLERREITPARMRSLLLRYPPMTIATAARIYLNAVRLKRKGVPYFSHPEGSSPWRR